MPDKKLNINQKTVLQLFDDSDAFFMIPDYQRPYAWTDEECSTLWEDLCAFACPDEDYEKFNQDDEYFLGSIVIFRNGEGKFEVIDGQQRLITLLLMLRAFYKVINDNFKDFRTDSNITPDMIEMLETVRRDIAKVIWQTDEFGKPDTSSLKIDSLVATDDDREEMMNILRNGIAAPKSKSKYARNYRFYLENIKELRNDKHRFSWLIYIPIRTLNKCILFPIEAGNQKSALRIFSTLNDRGKPLSDSDVFKAKLYKEYSSRGQKEIFIARWKDFEETCGKIIVTGKSTPVDDIFMRYMHYVRASKGIRDTSTDKLREFYGRDDEKFSLLRRNYAQTFNDVITLADFWRDVTALDSLRFSDRVLKRLFVLHYMPTNMWTFLVSVYFMTNKKPDGTLNEKKFYVFLQKITGFLLVSRIMIPGNTTPFYNEMVNIASGLDVTFSAYRFNAMEVRNRMENFDFNDSRKITKALVAWHVFQNDAQEIIPLEPKLDTEHIYPRGKIDTKHFESLGNKSLIESRINLRGADYSEKRKYYLGLIPRKKCTKIRELIDIADEKEYFTGHDIEQREREIIQGFIRFITDNGLTK